MELGRRNEIIRKVFEEQCVEPDDTKTGVGVDDEVRHDILELEAWFNNREVDGDPIGIRITKLVRSLMLWWMSIEYILPVVTSRTSDCIRKYFYDQCVPLLEKKGHDYSQGSIDGHKNFKAMAERFKGRGIDPIDVIGIYLFKHIEAIQTYLQDRAVRSEPIESRIADAVNYLLILYTALVEEQERHGNDCGFFNKT